MDYAVLNFPEILDDDWTNFKNNPDQIAGFWNFATKAIAQVKADLLEATQAAYAIVSVAGMVVNPTLPIEQALDLAIDAEDSDEQAFAELVEFIDSHSTVPGQE